MTRFPTLALFVVAAFVGLAAAGVWSGVAAQDATPSPEELEGLTFEPLGFGTAEELPPAPAGVGLARVRFEPGAGFPIEPGDPSLVLVYVESGALTFRMEAPIRVLRGAAMAAMAAAMATPGAGEEGAPPEPEEVAAGTEFVLEAGDSALFPPFVGGEARNDGPAAAVALAALIEPEGAAATPVP